MKAKRPPTSARTTRIGIRIPHETLEYFLTLAHRTGHRYQSLINAALTQAVESQFNPVKRRHSHFPEMPPDDDETLS